MDEDIYIDTINSELTGLNKDERNSKNKKFLIVLTIAIILIFLIIIIIIILIIPEKNINNGKEKEDKEKKEEKGNINCIYNIQSILQETNLFGNEFVTNTGFDVYI